MCLAVPGKLIERWLGVGEIPFGRVEFGSVRREVCLVYTPQVEIGEYVIVHVGFAIQVLDEQSARDALALWERLADE